MKLLKNLLCSALVLTSLSVSAEDAPAALKRFVDGVQTLSARFTQVQTDDQGKVLASSAGKMLLSRSESQASAGSGKFRWQYETPYQQLIVCDGQKVWLYDEDLSQVTVRPASDALKGTPVELLSQRALLSEAFTLEDGGFEGKLRKLRLKPKSGDNDFLSIELTLDQGTPVRMKFVDQLGGITDIAFNQIKTNLAIEARQFNFTPPAGTEVIDGTAQ